MSDDLSRLFSLYYIWYVDSTTSPVGRFGTIGVDPEEIRIVVL